MEGRLPSSYIVFILPALEKCLNAAPGIFTDAADPLDEEIVLIENRKKSAYFVFYH